MWNLEGESGGSFPEFCEEYHGGMRGVCRRRAGLRSAENDEKRAKVFRGFVFGTSL
jgi:hypothetical protein